MAPTVPTRRLNVVDQFIQRLSAGTSPVEPEASALDGFLTEGAVCCDVGAEFGLYTFTFARRVGASGRVLSFEPVPGPSSFLSRAVRWLRASNVAVHQAALGDTPGQATMSLPTRRGLPVYGRGFLVDGATGLGPNAEFPGEKRLVVMVSTLDMVVEEAGLGRVDFIKIDVEGYEPAVLRGADRTIRRFRPVLMIEIEDRHLSKYGADSSAVLRLMKEHGYTMSTLCDGRWAPVDAVTDRVRNYLFTPD